MTTGTPPSPAATARAGATGDPLAAWGRTRRIYPVVDKKVVFVSVAKNACTSLKWLMAEIAGEDLGRFQPGLAAFSTEEEGIHQRPLWQRVPRVDRLDPEVRRSIRPANGWFVFGVVRDPRTRLFSAWENKLLLRSPAYAAHAGQRWYPRPPTDTEQVIGDFARFVAAFTGDGPDHPLRRDPHFAAQTELLFEHPLEYSRIYQIGEIPALMADLTAHLRALGDHREYVLRSSNDTPLAGYGAVFAGGVREQIESVYAADFERFGDRWDFARVQAAPSWTGAELRHARSVAAMNQRIGDLLQVARDQHREAARQGRRADLQRERLRRAREQNRGLRRPPRRAAGIARRATRRAGRAARRAERAARRAARALTSR